jgi:hypothetical protein
MPHLFRDLTHRQETLPKMALSRKEKPFTLFRKIVSLFGKIEWSEEDLSS